MTRYRVFLLLFALSLAGGLMYGRALWWSIAGALFALIVIAIVWAWTGVNWLRVARRSSARVAQVGQHIEEEFRVTNLGRVPKLWLEVKDSSTLLGHYASRVVGWVGGGQWRGWRVRTRCLERGRYELGPITVRSGDPLGIYQMQRKIDLKNILLVHPLIAEFREFPMPMGYLPGGEALRRRTHYITTNAAGVRDYVNGDSINRIHWGLSAKRNRLIVKEFELDPMSDLWVVVDLHGAAHYYLEQDEPLDEAAYALPPDTEEYAVALAASAAHHFLRQDRLVGLVGYGQHRQVVPGDRGERQHNKIMETLAVVRADGNLPFDRVLKAELAQLPRGSTVVAISPSADVAWAEAIQQAMRSGLRVVAIVIDAETFGSPHSNADVVAALAETGAVVRVVKCGEPLAVAIERGVIL
jgi:uncharacterized protein (DUF58 family)